MEQCSIGLDVSQKNPNNDCKTCKYMAMPHDGGHCYTFRREPEELCYQYQPASNMLGALDKLRRSMIERQK